tara:strand:- start:12 stop:368 length:357 start_codon:yes stop_codon:yes gene_type:complete
MNYQWHIVSFDTIDETNYEGTILQQAVSRITWKRVGHLESNISSIPDVMYLGKSDISATNVSSDNFVSYQNIDEATALSWVLSGLTEEDINLIDNDLVRKLNKLETTKQDPPWWSKVQ